MTNKLIKRVQPFRPIKRSNKAIRLRRLRIRRLKMRRLRRKEKKGNIRYNKIGENNETTAPTHLELTILRLQKAKRKIDTMTLEKTFRRLSIIIIITRATTPTILLSQKIICSLGNFNIDDCQLEGFITYTLHLVSSLVSEK